MTTELLENAKNYFTEETKQQMSLSLDEETPNITRALSALFPLGMAAIIQKVKQGNGSAQSIYNLSSRAADNLKGSLDVAALNNEEQGKDVSANILGSHEKAVRMAIAKYGGIKNESAGFMLVGCMPVLLGLLGKHAKTNNFSPEQLESFLKNQEGEVKKNIPDGIKDVVSIFGLSNAVVDEKHIKDAVTTDVRQSKNKGWIAPVILAIIAVLLLVYFSKGCDMYLK